MIIPNIWENKKWQPNHQPDVLYPRFSDLRYAQPNFWQLNDELSRGRCAVAASGAGMWATQ